MDSYLPIIIKGEDPEQGSRHVTKRKFRKIEESQSIRTLSLSALLSDSLGPLKAPPVWSLFRGLIFQSRPGGGGFFRGTEILPRLINSVIASRMSSSNLSSFLWPVPPPMGLLISN